MKLVMSLNKGIAFLAAISMLSFYALPAFSKGSDVAPLIDSPFEAIEGYILDFVSDDGAVIGVVVEQCQGCTASTFLASPEIEVVEASGEEIGIRSVDEYEGKFGVVHVDKRTGMVFRVSFFKDR